MIGVVVWPVKEVVFVVWFLGRGALGVLGVL